MPFDAKLLGIACGIRRHRFPKPAMRQGPFFRIAVAGGLVAESSHCRLPAMLSVDCSGSASGLPAFSHGLGFGVSRSVSPLRHSRSFAPSILR
jgi:hypothetical protein